MLNQFFNLIKKILKHSDNDDINNLGGRVSTLWEIKAHIEKKGSTIILLALVDKL